MSYSVKGGKLAKKRWPTLGEAVFIDYGTDQLKVKLTLAQYEDCATDGVGK